MKHTALLLLLFLCSFASGHCQTYRYKILLVNDSKKEKIMIGKKKARKGRGDVFLGNDRIWWSSPKQTIEAICTNDGENYTFYASDYFEHKGRQKEKYAYVNYLRTLKTASKGSNHDTYSTLPVFMVNDTITIDEFTLPADANNTYTIQGYDAKRDRFVKLNPYMVEGHTLFFTRRQFEEAGVDVSNPDMSFTLFYNQKTIVNNLTISVVCVKY